MRRLGMSFRGIRLPHPSENAKTPQLNDLTDGVTRFGGGRSTSDGEALLGDVTLCSYW